MGNELYVCRKLDGVAEASGLMDMPASKHLADSKKSRVYLPYCLSTSELVTKFDKMSLKCEVIRSKAERIWKDNC